MSVGKANVLKEGKDVTIIGAGPILYEALLAAKKLARGKERIDIGVINLHTIKPFDKDTVLRAAKKSRAVVTCEDHQIQGGLGSAVAEVLARELPTPIEFVGVDDSFGESGKPEELIAKYGLAERHIIEAVQRVIKRK